MKTNYFLIITSGFILLVLSACGTVEQPLAVTGTVPPSDTARAASPTTPPATWTPPPASQPSAAPPEHTPTSGPVLFWTPELRQAIASAVDREALIDFVFAGRATPAYQVFPPNFPFYSEPFLTQYGTRDLRRARRLLSTQGYSAEKPFVLPLYFPDEPHGSTIGEVVQLLKEQLEETGMIKVELEPRPWPEFLEAATAGEFPAYLLGWLPDFTDPYPWLAAFASCALSQQAGINYCDDQMEGLLQAAARALDVGERAALYKQVGERLAEMTAVLPLYWEPEFIAYRAGIKGLAFNPMLSLQYNLIEFVEDAVPASGSTNTLIIGTTQLPEDLDPASATSLGALEILDNTSLPLLTFPPGTQELAPGSAAGLPEISTDGLTYTFTLQAGLTFADGQPVIGQDFVRSYERTVEIGRYYGDLLDRYLVSAESPKEKVVVYHLKDPYAFFPALTTSPAFIPVRPDQLPGSEPDENLASLDAAGPYLLVSFTPGEEIVLEANPEYIGAHQPLIPQVIVRLFPDPASLGIAIETGRIDIAWRSIGMVEAARLAKNEALVVRVIDAPALRFLAFNNAFLR